MSDIADPRSDFLTSQARAGLGPNPVDYLNSRFAAAPTAGQANAVRPADDPEAPAALAPQSGSAPFGLKIDNAIGSVVRDRMPPATGLQDAKDWLSGLDTSMESALGRENAQQGGIGHVLKRGAMALGIEGVEQLTGLARGAMSLAERLKGESGRPDDQSFTPEELGTVLAAGLGMRSPAGKVGEAGALETGAAASGAAEEGAAGAEAAPVTAPAPEGAAAAPESAAAVEGTPAAAPPPEAPVVPPEGAVAAAADAAEGPKVSEPVEGAAGEAAPGAAAAPESAADIFAAIEDPKELIAAGILKEPFKVNGESPDRLVVTPELREQARQFFDGGEGGNPIQASLESISHDSVMNDAIARAATFIKDGDVKPDQVMRSAAFQLNLQPEQILSGLSKNGVLMTDAETGAWAMLVNSTAREVQALAMKAKASNTAEDWEAFTRGYALQQHALTYWDQSGTEMARGFRARGLAWTARSDLAKSIQDIIANVGPEDIRKAADRISTLNDPDSVNGFISSLRKMSSRDGLLYGWYNYLLGPQTIVKKLASDATVGVWNLAARYAAEKFGSGAVQQGETAALLSGYAGAFQDAFKAAGKALAAGHSNFMSDYQTMDGTTVTRLDELAGGAIGDIPPDQPTTAAWRYLRTALPTTWVGAADDFAKVMNYRAELRALAYRSGASKGLEGDALSTHISDTLASVPQDLHEQAKAAALSNTFQDPLSGLAAQIQATADSMNLPLGRTGLEVPVGRIILPFVKVPANIMKFAYRNSPLPMAFPTQGYQAELRAGGATRDLALARVGIGTAVSIATAGLALGGIMTGEGPSDPRAQAAWRAAGNEPYSVKVGDTWYGYNRVEPLGMLMGVMADTHDVMKFAKDEDNESLAASMVFGAGNAMLSKTYMSGVANFFDALHAPDQDGKHYVDNLLASFAVPQTVAGIDRATDLWVRAHRDLLSTVEAKTPGLSETLPPLQGLWGDPIKQRDAFPAVGGGLSRMLSPIAEVPAESRSPIDSWIWDNRMAFPDDGKGGTILPTKPGHIQTWQAGTGLEARIELDPEQYAHFVSLAGNELKGPDGLGAKDMLSALVEGKHPDASIQAQWDRAAPAARALIVGSTIAKFRSAARKQLAAEDLGLQETINANLTGRAGQLQGTQ